MIRVRFALIVGTLAAALVAAPSMALAQPTFETSSATGTVGGAGSTITVNAPSGVSSGDLLVACVQGSGASADTSTVTATGWTEVGQVGGGAAQPKTAMLWKAWDAGDGGSYVFTIGGQSYSSRRGWIARISGADTASPSAATIGPTNSLSSGSTSRDYASITTSVDDALLIGCMTWTANDATYTNDAALSDVITAQNRNGGDYVVQASAGASTAYAGSGTSSPWSSLIWAVAPGTVNTSPTVTLSSPADAATGVSVTPTLTFVCTDADGDPCTVQVQITDNPDDWTGGEVLTASYSTGSTFTIHPQPLSSGTSPTTGEIQLDERPCQSFLGRGGRVTRAGFYFGEDDEEADKTDGTYSVRLYAHDGTFGTNSRPAGAPLPSPAGSATNGTNTPTVGWLGHSGTMAIVYPAAGGNAWREVAFSGDQVVRTVTDTPYVSCLEWVPADRNIRNTITVQTVSSGTHEGNAWLDGDSANYGDAAGDGAFGWDVWFRVYETFVLVDVASDTDGGFSNQDDGGDSDPFTSGDTLGYAPSTLAYSTTFYWRVRGSDPAGTDTYGSWSSTRSFTTVDEPADPGTSGRARRRLLLRVGAAQ